MKERPRHVRGLFVDGIMRMPNCASALADKASRGPAARRRYEGISMRCPWTAENAWKPLVWRADGWHHARHRRGCSTRLHCAGPDGRRAAPSLWRYAMGARRCRRAPLPAASVSASPMQALPAFVGRGLHVQRLPLPARVTACRPSSCVLRWQLPALAACLLAAVPPRHRRLPRRCSSTPAPR